MNDFVRIGEKIIATEVWNAIMNAYRDPLGREAIEFAAKQKWLGRFECKKDADSWRAQISATDVKTRVDHNMIYKDVTLNIELAAQ